MNWLVYGIVDAARAAGEELPPGLGGEALFRVTEGPLAALVSRHARDEAGRGVEQALHYAQVIEGLHRRMTILPMRYGCLVASLRQVSSFLHEQEENFREALRTIEGCEEMGLRILLPDAGTGAEGSQPAGSQRQPPATGAAYLEQRRRYYEQQARAEAACREWAARARAAFSGLYRHSSWEFMHRPEGSLLSLSFLVKRSDVSHFQAACAAFRRSHAVAAICSGPWPPYVFGAGLVQPEVATEAGAMFLKP